MKSNSITPFNNDVDTGLRMLCLLNESHPVSFDLQKLIYLDYITIHSGDMDKSTKSIHPPVPYRSGELLIRRSIIQSSLELFISCNLVEKIYTKTGIEYIASEDSSTFLETLEEEYFIKLNERAKWAIKNYSDLSNKELKVFLDKNLDGINNEFNIEILQ